MTFELALVVESTLVAQASSSFAVEGTLVAQASSPFVVESTLVAQASSSFAVEGTLVAQASSSFVVEGTLVAQASSSFVVESTLVAQASSSFAVEGTLVAQASSPFVVESTLVVADEESSTLTPCACSGGLKRTRLIAPSTSWGSRWLVTRLPRARPWRCERTRTGMCRTSPENVPRVSCPCPYLCHSSLRVSQVSDLGRKPMKPRIFCGNRVADFAVTLHE
ncbi:MAG: hypothetical protein QM784_28555 [Polyangiaceae bacterium]